MKPLEKPFVEEPVDLGEKSRVVVYQDEKHQGKDHGAVKYDQRLCAACFDPRCKKATDEQPDQDGQEDKVTYEESKGQKI